MIRTTGQESVRTPEADSVILQRDCVSDRVGGQAKVWEASDSEDGEKAEENDAGKQRQEEGQ